MKKISVIVPVYNEEVGITHVLETLVSYKRFHEIICVNDGSSDGSLKKIRKFKGKIIIIDIQPNKGKGNAIVTGVKKSTGDLIMFVDADISNLTHEHLDKMLHPIISDSKIDAVLAYELGHLVSIFTGERVYYKKDLIPVLDEIQHSKFGMEVILNKAFRKKKVKRIRLKNMGHLEKKEKHDAKIAKKEYFDQWFGDVFKQILKSGITPRQFLAMAIETPIWQVTQWKKEFRKRGKV